jgi:RNA polymerase sigma-70 factor (ECF subfamily)
MTAGSATWEAPVNNSMATAELTNANQTVAAVSELAARPGPFASRDSHFARLMSSAQDGDRTAYAELLAQVAPLLRRWIQSRRRFIQAADIEDLVQDTLLSVHAARATYDPERPFLPWLMTIAHNRMVDGARRHARRSANEVQTEELPAHVADDDANHPRGDYHDPEALRRAVIDLPPGQRTAIELLKLREMSLKEAAAVSGMSISALKTSVHRAIKSLRVSLHS